MGKHDRVENGLNLDEGAPASNSKIPLPLKVFGILCIVSGAALVPVLALLIVGMVMALQQGAIVEPCSSSWASDCCATNGVARPRSPRS